MDAFGTLPGWHLLGAFPDGEPDDVGSWLLHAGGEALLLELPPGLNPKDVMDGLSLLNVRLRFVTASHLHEDHLDPEVWNSLIDIYPDAKFLCPSESRGDSSVHLGGEPVFFIKAPKHSKSDVVTVFRGVAMTGDIELGTVDSVNREVSKATKAASMKYLQDFENRSGHHVNTVLSAHLNDFRQNVEWSKLFDIS